MVRLVRSGKSMHSVAAKFHVDPSTVSFWVSRARDCRLDRVDFSDRAPGCPSGWNRTPVAIEQHILELRRSLREDSDLGEYGARAIHAALRAERDAAPSMATINRVLSRHGLQDTARRVRRPPPPRGWYLPEVAAGRAELDCFDFIEDRKIAEGPLVDVLTGKSLLGALTDAWVLSQLSAKGTDPCLRARWQRDGLPAYAQFDNGTVFQGAHQFADAVGRTSRLCLALGVIPVFVPPLEHGMQNTIEGFNGLWQAKVWQRHRVASIAELQACSDRYIAAHRARTQTAADAAPPREPMPKHFELDLHTPLRGQMIFIRRTNETGQVHLLGRCFTVSPDWLHRLVRCEVDFDHHCIRCFALRRRAPTEQPLLATIEYHRTHKPFYGEL
jgi:transposase-like protein